MNPARITFRMFAATACVLLLALSAPAAEPGPAHPLPESRREHTGSQRQRIRYRNSPLLQQAHDQTAAGNYAAAETTLEHILVNDPDNNTAGLMLIQVAKQQGHRARALTLLNDLLACYPGVPKLHTERAYLLQQAGQYQAGPTFFALDKLMVTLPEALLVGRYQDNDPDGIGTYWYYGAGLSFRLLEGERALTRDRWTVSGYAHYAFGRFDTLPEAADRNDFEGWIIGLQVQL